MAAVTTREDAEDKSTTNEPSFDTFAKAVATPCSRRHMLRLIIGGALAAVTGCTPHPSHKSVGMLPQPMTGSSPCPPRQHSLPSDCKGIRVPAYPNSQGSESCWHGTLVQHAPSTCNGCGPGKKGAPSENKYPILDKLPKTIGANFTPACNEHDVCYGTCGRDKSDCDTAFLRGMLAACQDLALGPALRDDGQLTTGTTVTTCLSYAYAYYSVVSLKGQDAFDTAQEQGCECCLCPEGCNAPCQQCDRDTGTCESTCATGLSCCEGQCVDLNASHDNCGACGHRCQANEYCDGHGHCVQRGEWRCDGDPNCSTVGNVYPDKLSCTEGCPNGYSRIACALATCTPV